LLPFANRAILCKSFRFVLIVSQFAPTSIFLHFQGLVAMYNEADYTLTFTKLQNNMLFFAPSISFISPE